MAGNKAPQYQVNPLELFVCCFIFMNLLFSHLPPRCLFTDKTRKEHDILSLLWYIVAMAFFLRLEKRTKHNILMKESFILFSVDNRFSISPKGDWSRITRPPLQYSINNNTRRSIWSHFMPGLVVGLKKGLERRYWSVRNTLLETAVWK